MDQLLQLLRQFIEFDRKCATTPNVSLSRERSKGSFRPRGFGREIFRPDRGGGLDLQMDATRFQSTDNRGREAVPASFARAGDIHDRYRSRQSRQQ